MRFSIIVPVHNGEKTLPGCIAALLAQPCQDMEILLVEQGSEDASAMLCQGYRAAYPDRIRVITDHGTGPARNTGIRQARGTYLLFADCETLLRQDALACLSRQIEEFRADLYLLAAAERHRDIPQSVRLSLEEHPELLLEQVDVRDVLWKRQLFDDAYLRFPEEPGYDDLRLTRKAMALSRSIVAVPEGIHQRRAAPPAPREERELALLDALDDILRYFQRRGLLERCNASLTQLAGLLICDRAYHVLRGKQDPVCLSECIQYLKARFPDYQSVPMPPWRGWETEKLLEMIRQGRWKQLRMLFLLKKGR